VEHAYRFNVMRHYEEVENMLQEVLKTFGKVDVLLNNAAGNFILLKDYLQML
jgi:NAD(P)-dependent dehydrogenase (short-subunit alcohol dehydrogenase family)